MLIGLTRALPSAMRESTDEEVSEFIRRLLPDRLERQKTAIRQALEAADRRELSRSAPRVSTPDLPDEPATVLEGIGRETTPSADGRSLPGASSSEPPPSAARGRSRRNLLLAASGGAVLLIGAGLGLAFGRSQVAGSNAATPLVATPASRTSSAVGTPVPSNASPDSAPETMPPEEPVSSASASAATSAPRVTGRRTPGVKTTAPTPSSRKGPFVSPIRNPGF
jgi:hypothetical protein